MSNPTSGHTAEASSMTLAGARRWRYIAAGALLMFSLGLIYTWSIFMPPLEREFGWTRPQSSMGFAILMATFGVGCFVFGLFSRKASSRALALTGTLIIGAGFALASMSDSLMVMYIAYGVLVGFGAGFAYNAVLSTQLKWFPDRIGSASGIMLMSLGCGAFFLNMVGAWMLEFLTWRQTFLVFGLFTVVVFVVLNFFIKPPPQGLVFPAPRNVGKRRPETAGDMPTTLMLRRPTFYFFFLWGTFASFASMSMFGHASPMAQSLGAEATMAGFLAGLISLCNGCGRLICGTAFDLFGRRAVMYSVSCACMLCGATLFFCISIGSLGLLTLAFILAGFFHGGIMPTNSSVMGTFYGLKYYAMNLSVIMLGMVPFSLFSPYLSGVLHSIGDSYLPVSGLVIACGFLSLIVSLGIKKP